MSVNLTINKLVYNHRIQSNKNFLLHKLKFKSLTPFYKNFISEHKQDELMRDYL